MTDDMGEPQFETATATVPGPKLEPFTPVKDELSSFDPFGRPMSKQVPKGNWRLKTISPYDQFVRNLGVDEKPNTLDEFTIVEVVPIDYVRNHFPNGHLVKAEQPAVLMMFHPVAGERTIYQGTGAGGPGMFRNHVRLKRKFQKPRMEVPKGEDGKPIPNAPAQPNRGRAVVMAGDVVLEDGDFQIESQNNPGTWINKAVVARSCPESDDECPVTNGGNNANTASPATPAVVAHRNATRAPTTTSNTTTAVTSQARGSSNAPNSTNR